MVFCTVLTSVVFSPSVPVRTEEKYQYPYFTTALGSYIRGLGITYDAKSNRDTKYHAIAHFTNYYSYPELQQHLLLR